MGMKEPRVQPPTLDVYSDMPLFNTKAVVHQTGVPAPTLRAWERRYGILSPRRGENDYRLYSERDMAVVSWLRERVDTGMTISQAIALLRSLEPPRKRNRRSRSSVPTGTLDRIEIAVTTPPPLLSPPTFSLTDISALLVRQFRNLDEFAAGRTIAQMLSIYSVEDVCLLLFVPVLAEIGRQWADGEISVTVEHFASGIIRAQLESLFRIAATDGEGPLVLVGCAPGELHELGALMLALFLRRAAVRVAYLGQSIEVESLLSTVASLHPAGVLLSAAVAPPIEALAEIGQRIAALPEPHPVYCFGGQAFAGEVAGVQQIPGVFLRMNARDAVQEVKRRVSA